MGTRGALSPQGRVMVFLIGLTLQVMLVMAQDTASYFQVCTTSCKNDEGGNLPSGNYPLCDQCNSFAQCNSGYLTTQQCPPGTTFYNRKLGVCDRNISVCVNDSLYTPPTPPTAPAATSTSGPATSPVILTTTTTLLTTTSTTTTSSPPPPTTTTAKTTTTTTQAITSSTTTSRPFTITKGFTPSPGAEADSFWFAMDFYNKFSKDPIHVGALSVDSITSEVSDTGSAPNGDRDTMYRVTGVTLVKSTCPNTPTNVNADYETCPLQAPDGSGSNPNRVAKCSFKVRRSPQQTGPASLAMVYMMCYK